MRTAIINTTIVMPDHLIPNATILVENGKIIESGNHDDLIRADGKYASMFNLQASKYKSESVENNN